MNRAHSGGGSETVQAVVRALSILEALAEVAEPIALSDLAKKVGLKLATVHRLLATLMSKGYVTQDQLTLRYQLGIKAFEVGNAALASLDIRAMAHPFLKQLRDEVNETTNMAILDGAEVVYIDQLESTNIVIVKMFARVGSRGPAYCTGSGKMLLAGLPDDELHHLVNQMVFQRFTQKTITDKELLIKEIQRIREQGYAIDNAERDEGVCCIAAPIRNHEGRTIAAISASGPTSRVNPETYDWFIAAVTKTADNISKCLGYKNPAKTG